MTADTPDIEARLRALGAPGPNADAETEAAWERFKADPRYAATDTGKIREVDLNPQSDTQTAPRTLLGVDRQAHGASRNRCGGVCPSVSGGQAHCAVCHETFSRVSGFDYHRRNGACVDPVTIDMERDTRGVWRKPISDSDAARLAAIRHPDGAA